MGFVLTQLLEETGMPALSAITLSSILEKIGVTDHLLTPSCLDDASGAIRNHYLLGLIQSRIAGLMPIRIPEEDPQGGLSQISGIVSTAYNIVWMLERQIAKPELAKLVELLTQISQYEELHKMPFPANWQEVNAS